MANEHEAAWLAGQLGCAAEAVALRGALGIDVAVTLGEAGAGLATAAGLLRVPAFPVPVADTTGAGDAWCGVLAAALDRGLPLPAALRRASAAGGAGLHPARRRHAGGGRDGWAAGCLPAG